MTHALIPSETGRGEGTPREANQPTEVLMNISLRGEVSALAVLAGWSSPQWLFDLASLGEAVRASDRQYFDAVASVLDHWIAVSKADKVAVRRLLSVGRIPKNAPTERLRALIHGASPEWKAAALAEFVTAYEAYSAEYVGRRPESVGAVSESDTIYLCELRARLDSLSDVMTACAFDGSFAREVETVRGRLVEIDRDFEREVVPKFQSSRELAFNERLLSAAWGRPDGWWGTFALNAGEVYAGDPSDIEEDFVEAISVLELAERKGYHQPRRGGPKTLQ